MGAARSTFRDDFTAQIDTTMLSAQQRQYVTGRYIALVESAKVEQRRLGAVYSALVMTALMSGVFTVALSGLISPTSPMALDSATAVIAWLIFALSIVTTLANKFVFAYDMPKKWVAREASCKKLQSEGWSFALMTDRYSALPQEDAFALFCSRIEKIHLKESPSGAMSPGPTAGEVVAMGPRHSSARGDALGDLQFDSQPSVVGLDATGSLIIGQRPASMSAAPGVTDGPRRAPKRVSYALRSSLPSVLPTRPTDPSLNTSASADASEHG